LQATTPAAGVQKDLSEGSSKELVQSGPEESSRGELQRRAVMLSVACVQ